MIEFRVSGLVQGVGFRYSTAHQAKNLKIRGWVRNCSNGDVEGQALGPEEKIKAFTEFLKKGPSGSRVDKVDLKEVDDVELVEEFKIRH